MKILQILPQLNYGGVERGTVELAQALIARGHKAYVISAGGELVGQLVKMGATHFEIPVHKKSLSSLRLIKKVRTIIDKERIDIVHARSRIPAWIAYFATRSTNAKFITTCHGYYSKHFLSRVMGWGERVIVISHAVGRRMIDDFGVLPERITLVHRGVDLEKYEFDKDRYDQEQLKHKDKFIIANIGRLTRIKGHEYFIRAIHLLSHQYPQVEAWIVGGCSPRKIKYVDSLKVLVDKLGMNNSIKFLGVDENIPALLKKIDLLVLSTTYPEGFGRVIIEAGASGVSVVATKVGGVSDIIEDGKEGLLVPPCDEYKMSDAIVRMVGNPSLARTLAHNLRKKIEQCFTLERMIDKTIAIYQEVRAARRIVVVKLGALGDVILAVPSLRMLRKKYPKAFLAVVVDADLTSCLEHCPYIDEIIPFKRKDKKNVIGNMYQLVKKLKKYSFDISVDFQNNAKTHIISFLAGIPSRYGYNRGICGPLLSHRVGAFRDPLPPVQHQFRVLSLLGVTEYDEQLELWPQEEDYHYVDVLFQKVLRGEKKQTIGFVLNASNRWVTKKWPVDYFVKLAERLTRDFKVTVVLIGTERSEDYDYFCKCTPSHVIDAIGKTTIPQLAALMDKLDGVVCGDTAPLHVASAMGTKSVSLFGPTDPRRHTPPGNNNVIVRRNLSCSPCYEETCSLEHRCMKEINVDDVYSIVRKWLV